MLRNKTSRNERIQIVVRIVKYDGITQRQIYVDGKTTTFMKPSDVSPSDIIEKINTVCIKDGLVPSVRRYHKIKGA